MWGCGNIQQLLWYERKNTGFISVAKAPFVDLSSQHEVKNDNSYQMASDNSQPPPL